MSKMVIVFHSGCGRTGRKPQSVAEGEHGSLVAIDAGVDGMPPGGPDTAGRFGARVTVAARRPSA